MDLLARKEAALQAQQYLQLQPVYLDTETTGRGLSDEVIEIGIVDHEGAILVQSYVRARTPIQPDAQRVHGITPDKLAGAPTWGELWPSVEKALDGKMVGFYNSEFDLALMKQSHQRNWLRWNLPEANFFCIMKLYARFYGEWDRQRGTYRNQSLEMAGQQCHISLPNSHRAIDDACLARELLLSMARWKPS
jgi:DNA polymerase III subunit epsilon